MPGKFNKQFISTNNLRKTHLEIQRLLAMFRDEIFRKQATKSVKMKKHVLTMKFLMHFEYEIKKMGRKAEERL